MWGFLEEPVNAGELRFALSPYIDNRDTYDRMFPNQDGTTESSPYGNLIALPLNGKLVNEGNTAFIEVENDEVVVIDDQKAYVQDFVRIPSNTILELFENRKAREAYNPSLGSIVREGDPENLKGIYKVVHPKLGCEWVRWCMENPTEVTEPDWYVLACQFAQLSGGREMFHKASEADPRYNPKDTDAKFDNALGKNAPQGCQYIRENCNGPLCKCDERYAGLGVLHPYDIAKIPFSQLIEFYQEEEGMQSAHDGVYEALNKAKAKYKDPNAFVGYKYGWAEIDDKTELRMNDLVICAARPGRGKTAFIIDLAYRLWMQDVPVMVFSMEMSKSQFWDRFISRVAEVDGRRLRNASVLIKPEWTRLARATQKIRSKDPILFVDDSTYDTWRS